MLGGRGVYERPLDEPIRQTRQQLLGNFLKLFRFQDFTLMCQRQPLHPHNASWNRSQKPSLGPIHHRHNYTYTARQNSAPQVHSSNAHEMHKTRLLRCTWRGSARHTTSSLPLYWPRPLDCGPAFLISVIASAMHGGEKP